ncbi:MAG: DUF1648 domain-containing protein [Chloroflexi bacterium]|nr:DUF1648 domain-containing protein [Chloroflexota bacterium]
MEDLRPDYAPPESPESLQVDAEGPVQEQAPRLLALLASDRVFQITLVVALIADLALFAYLAATFDTLPDPLPLHFDASGLPDRIDAKSGIFALPIIGLIVFATNSAFGAVVHRHQRAASLLLAAGALIVELLLWSAAISIAGR